MTDAARRLAAVFPLAIIATSIVASAPVGAGAAAPQATDIYPTQFDYLVLASIADSQQPFSMAGYHAMGRGAQAGL
jgi:hypothetical protein